MKMVIEAAQEASYFLSSQVFIRSSTKLLFKKCTHLKLKNYYKHYFFLLYFQRGSFFSTIEDITKLLQH